MAARVSARGDPPVVLAAPSDRLEPEQKVGNLQMNDHTIALAPSGRPRVWNDIDNGIF